VPRRGRFIARHGMATDNMYGVSIADLKVISKKIKGDQRLALGLFATGNVDAMYLAGMVADGSKMSTRELQAWGRRRGRIADDCRISGAVGGG